MDLFNLYATIGLKDDGFKSGINEAQKGTAGLSTGIKSMVSTVASIKLVSAAFDLIKGSIGGAVERYDTLNQFPKVLQQMGFSAQEAAISSDKLVAGIDGLPTTLPAISSLAQSIALTSGNLQEATSVSLALNDALLASGATTGDVTRATDQYQKMLATGTVTQVSWNTLQETMKYGLTEVAKELGITSGNTQELYQALKDGDITFDAFNKALIKCDTATGGFADTASAASAGIGTSLQNMKNSVVSGMAGIITSFDKAAKNNALPTISESLDLAKVGFKTFFSVAQSATTGLVNTVAPAIKVLANNLDYLAPTVLAGVAAFQGYKIVATVSASMEVATRAIEGATAAQAALTFATETGAAATELASFMNDKAIASETVRTAAKAAGMTVSAEGVVLTAAGTVATEAESAAVLASAGAMSAKTVILGVMTGAMTIAEAASIALSAAMTALPLIGVVAGIASLAAMLVVGIKGMSSATKYTDEYTLSLIENAKASKEATEATEKSSQSYVSLARQIAQLTGVSEKTESQTAELAAKVRILNDALGDIGIAYDSTTDSVNMTNEELLANAEAFGNTEKLESYSTELLDLTTAHDELAAAVEENRDKYETLTAAIEGKDMISVQEEQTTREATHAYEESAQLLAENEERQNELAAAMQTAAGQTEVTAVAAESLSNTYANLSDASKIAFDSMAESMVSYRDTAIDSFNQISNQSEISLNQMTENLNANANTMEQYWVDIAELSSKGVDAGILMPLMDGSEESLQIIRSMNSGSQDELNNYIAAMGRDGAVGSENWVNAMKAVGMEGELIAELSGAVTGADAVFEGVDWTPHGQDLIDGVSEGIESGTGAFTDSITKMATTGSEGLVNYDWASNAQIITQESANGIDANSSTFVGAIEKMASDASESFTGFDWNNSGAMVMAGATEGVTSNTGTFLDAVKKSATDADDGFRSAMGIHSPSTVMAENGQYMMEGVAQGITQGAGLVQSAFEQVTSMLSTASMSGLDNITTTFTQRFTNITTIVSSWGKTMGSAVTSSLQTVSSTASSSLSMLQSTFTSRFSAITGMISSWSGSASQAMSVAMNNMNNSVNSGMNNLSNSFSARLNNMVAQVAAWGSRLASAGSAAAAAMKNAVMSGAQGIDLTSVGYNIVNGVQNGMAARRAGFYSYVSSYFAGIAAQANAALDIHSPSRVMAEFGVNTVDGAIVGMESRAKALENTVDDVFVPNLSALDYSDQAFTMSSNVSPKESGYTSGVSGAGDISIHVDTVTKTPYEAAKAVERTMKDIRRRNGSAFALA